MTANAGRNTVVALGAKGRKDALQFDPEDITLVTDKDHPLYDERVHWTPSDEFVRNIKYHGVIKAIIVRRNGENERGRKIVECVDGRQRVLAARIANKQLHEEGKPPIMIYALVRSGDDASLNEVMVSTNEARKNDDAMTRAAKMQRLANLGRTFEQIAVSFCCSVKTVRSTIALLDLDKSVQKAVLDNVITPTFAAKEFSKVPRETQREHLEKLVASGVTKGNGARENIGKIKRREEADAEHQARVRSRAHLEKFRDALKEMSSADALVALAVVNYALGSDRALRSVHADVRAAARTAGEK